MVTIHKPTLLLNRERAIANIQTMATRAQQSQVRFRPHFKTHQSAHIGEWFRTVGVEAITVSSVSMGLYFAQHGWQDITIAFPTNILEIEAINQLAGQVKLGLLVESEQTVRFLADNLTGPVDLWIEIDVGYGRSGVDWADSDTLDALATEISSSERLILRGILTHAGHAYKARSKIEIEVTYQDMVFKMKAARSRLGMAGVENIEISIGDTPTCSVVHDLSEVDEIRPGNFVFYDVMQLHIGACQVEDIALGVACPVVAKYPEQHRLVLYGGAIHLSKEFITDKQEIPYFGYVTRPTVSGWGPPLAGVDVSSLSQEHGLVTGEEATLNQINIGDIVIVLPIHSCLTANLMRKYYTLEGELISMGSFDEA
jgi:D-serine deaminase-like pyridoxal phosphate-dependent protein